MLNANKMLVDVVYIMYICPSMEVKVDPNLGRYFFFLMNPFLTWIAQRIGFEVLPRFLGSHISDPLGCSI